MITRRHTYVSANWFQQACNFIYIKEGLKTDWHAYDGEEGKTKQGCHKLPEWRRNACYDTFLLEKSFFLTQTTFFVCICWFWYVWHQFGIVWVLYSFISITGSINRVEKAICVSLNINAVVFSRFWDVWHQFWRVLTLNLHHHNTVQII